MERPDRFRALAADSGLPSEAVEEWIRGVLPAGYLSEGGDGPLVARMGGDPLLPTDAPTPSDPFVADVDLAALPPGATNLPLPADGRLLFFASPDVGGAQGVRPDTVLYVPAGTPTVVRPLDEAWRKPYQPRELRTFWQAPAVREPESFALETWGEEADEEEFELAEQLDDAWGAAGENRPVWVLQLGGHPVYPQNDPVHHARYSDESVDDWTLLATWRCGDDVTELDSGIAHWVIRRRDLDERRFDRVHRYVEMA